MEEKTYCIGDVSFRRPGCGWVREPFYTPTGDNRVELLKRLYNDEDLGGWEPFVRGKGYVFWWQVNWDTAGKRITVSEEILTYMRGRWAVYRHAIESVAKEMMEKHGRKHAFDLACINGCTSMREEHATNERFWNHVASFILYVLEPEK